MAEDLLSPGEATAAINTYLTASDVEPYKQPSLVTSVSSASPVKTIYRYGQSSASETQFWFQSTNDVNFVKGPVENDTEEKTYYTGHLAYPSKTKNTVATTSAPYPTTSLPMGLQKPAAPITAVVSGTATDPDSAAEGVVYVCTLVTAWGEEGPPSDASALYTWRAGQTITLTLPTGGTASYPGNSNKSQSYTTKRIYRSATGSAGSARYLYLGEVSLATTSYTDTALTSSLSTALPSRGWLEPPDSMVGLTQMANGILAGFSGSTVCFSEPFVPHAWPVAYQQAVDAPVVAIAAFGQSLLVSTTRSLYVFTGSHPSDMTSERLAVSQACVSKRSMIEFDNGVVFATPDGLGYIGPGGFRLLTDGLMQRRDWQRYAPTSMAFYECDNKLIGFYDTGTTRGGIVFTFGEHPSFCETDLYATAGFRERGRDALYLCFDDSGSTRLIKKWDNGSTPLSMTWTSGVFRMNGPTNIAVARLDFTGSVYFELIADGVVVFGPTTPTNMIEFWLPSHPRGLRYQVRVTGTGNLRAVELADSMESLSSGN